MQNANLDTVINHIDQYNGVTIKLAIKLITTYCNTSEATANMMLLALLDNRDLRLEVNPLTDIVIVHLPC
jgi:hypothetical protein